jgi:uncharacterized cupredoxin-like copper-binding protein
MQAKFGLTALFTVFALIAGNAFAHGDEEHPAKKKPFDSTKVEEKAFGREGDPKKVTRVIKLGMTDAMRYTPSDVVVKRGETVKFVLHNEGKILHEMVLGTSQEIKEHAALMKKFPDMEHSEPNMAHVKPGANGEMVWQFTKAGQYQFACLMPGHFEAGMVGQVTVK